MLFTSVVDVPSVVAALRGLGAGPITQIQTRPESRVRADDLQPNHERLAHGGTFGQMR